MYRAYLFSGISGGQHVIWVVSALARRLNRRLLICDDEADETLSFEIKLMQATSLDALPDVRKGRTRGELRNIDLYMAVMLFEEALVIEEL